MIPSWGFAFIPRHRLFSSHTHTTTTAYNFNRKKSFPTHYLFYLLSLSVIQFCRKVLLPPRTTHIKSSFPKLSELIMIFSRCGFQLDWAIFHQNTHIHLLCDTSIPPCWWESWFFAINLSSLTPQVRISCSWNNAPGRARCLHLAAPSERYARLFIRKAVCVCLRSHTCTAHT
jgi:hypothetical protein